MNAEQVLARLRRFLLALTLVLCGGTILELWALEHTQNLVQLIPFGLCGLGVGLSGAALWRPNRAVFWVLRGGMGVVALGCGFGIYEHMANNLELVLELKPLATPLELFTGVVGGASPLLAPGMLLVAALLAWAASYQHPALAQ